MSMRTQFSQTFPALDDDTAALASAFIRLSDRLRHSRIADPGSAHLDHGLPSRHLHRLAVPASTAWLKQDEPATLFR